MREGLALGASSQREARVPRGGPARPSLDALAARFSGWSAERAERREALGRRALPGARAAAVAGEVRGGAPARPRALLDIGRTVDFFDRHEHVADLVLATDLGGFSHRQVALVSAIVRQAGRRGARRGRSPRSCRREDASPSSSRPRCVLALADEITERCPPGSRRRRAASARGRARRRSAVPALASWGVRGLDERFAPAFGRLRVVLGAR